MPVNISAQFFNSYMHYLLLTFTTNTASLELSAQESRHMGAAFIFLTEVL